MRGKVGYRGSVIPLRGITPAWAGKRKHEITQKSKYGDHPRMGGEKMS